MKGYIYKTIDINRRIAQPSKHSHHLANAIKKYGIDKDTSHIVSCCKGRRKTAYGFIWKYEEKEVIHG